MPDRFTKKLELYAPKNSDRAEVGQALSRRLRRALAEFGDVSPESVHVSDTDGNRFERNTLAEAKAALDEYGLKIKRVSFDSSAVDRTNSFSTLGGASVNVWWGYESTSNVDIEVWAYSKVHVDGMVAAVEVLFDRIKSDPSLVHAGGDATAAPSHAAPEQAAGASPVADSAPGKVSSTTITTSGPSGSAPRQGRLADADDRHRRQDSWLRRTWRDHAAALLISLVSAVLAGLILWALLGHS